MIKFLKSIFSNVLTYLLILFISCPTILAIGLVQHYRDNQIIEVLEQVEEPEKIIEVVSASPDQEFQNLSLRNESQGVFTSDDFIDGRITGDLRFNYKFNDGSSSTELFDVEEYFKQNIPGEGSKRLLKAFVKGKYKIRSGEVVSISSKTKLKVGDYSKNNFDPQYEWSDIKSYDKPIDTVVKSTRLITNGKVSSKQEVSHKITIKPNSEKKKDKDVEPKETLPFF